MNLSFQDVFLATLQILLMGFCGYLLVRRGLVGAEGLKLLSQLLIKFFLPMMIFDQFTRVFSFERFADWWMFPLISFGMAWAAFGISRLMLLFLPDLRDRRELNLLVMFQNSGYFQLLIASALFGGVLVERLNIYIFLYMSAHAVLFWSFGIWWLLGKQPQKVSWVNVINPPLVTLFVSIILVVLGWNKGIPDTLRVPIELFGQCTLPLSVLVVGGSLASVSLKDLNVRAVSGVVLCKLIILPLLMLLIVCNIRMDALLGAFLVLQACAPSALILPIVARYYKIDARLIDQAVFFTYILSPLTISVFLSWYLRAQGL